MWQDQLTCAYFAETALSRLEAKNMLTNYKINAMGPILVSKVCKPHQISVQVLHSLFSSAQEEFISEFESPPSCEFALN